MKTLSSYTVKELKQAIRKHNIKGYSTMKKPEIIKLMKSKEHYDKFKYLHDEPLIPSIKITEPPKKIKKKEPQSEPVPKLPKKQFKIKLPKAKKIIKKKKEEPKEEPPKKKEPKKEVGELPPIRPKIDKKKLVPKLIKMLLDGIKKYDDNSFSKEEEKKYQNKINLFIKKNEFNRGEFIENYVMTKEQKEEVEKVLRGLKGKLKNYTPNLEQLDSLNSNMGLMWRIKPKGKEPAKKEIPQNNLETILDVYERKKLENPVPFICNRISKYTFLNYIMKKNKNDCLMYLKRKDEYFEFVFKGAKMYSSLEDLDKNIVMDIKEEAKKIADRYKQCKKNKKILAIPATIRILGGHQNIVIFNYVRKEVEHFEPHGEKSSHISNRFNKIMQNKIKEVVKQVNNNLPKEEKLKYIAPYDICPAGFKSFQSHENEQIRKVRNFGKYNVNVERDDGYCCAWSFFYLDLRLQQLKESGIDIFKKTTERVKENPILLKEFIRGLTNDFYENSIRLVNVLGRKNKWNEDQKRQWWLYLFYASEWRDENKAEFQRFLEKNKNQTHQIDNLYELLHDELMNSIKK